MLDFSNRDAIGQILQLDSLLWEHASQRSGCDRGRSFFCGGGNLGGLLDLHPHDHPDPTLSGVRVRH